MPAGQALGARPNSAGSHARLRSLLTAAYVLYWSTDMCRNSKTSTRSASRDESSSAPASPLEASQVRMQGNRLSAAVGMQGVRDSALPGRPSSGSTPAVWHPSHTLSALATVIACQRHQRISDRSTQGTHWQGGCASGRPCFRHLTVCFALLSFDSQGVQSAVSNNTKAAQKKATGSASSDVNNSPPGASAQTSASSRTTPRPSASAKDSIFRAFGLPNSNAEAQRRKLTILPGQTREQIVRGLLPAELFFQPAPVSLIQLSGTAHEHTCIAAYTARRLSLSAQLPFEQGLCTYHMLCRWTCHKPTRTPT